MLADYQAPAVVHPSIESLLRPQRRSLLSSLFHTKPLGRKATQIPPNLPKGLYMYGDVGSGKTMLMDMFYETLPQNVTSKTRIHFHNFMQDVHKRLHMMKLEHGTDMDAVSYVAAELAEESSVLCFDEFQCTDVADAMILRRWVSSPRKTILQILSDRMKFTRSTYEPWRRLGDNVKSPSRRALHKWNPTRVLCPMHQPTQESATGYQS